MEIVVRKASSGGVDSRESCFPAQKDKARARETCPPLLQAPRQLEHPAQVESSLGEAPSAFRERGGGGGRGSRCRRAAAPYFIHRVCKGSVLRRAYVRPRRFASANPETGRACSTPFAPSQNVELRIGRKSNCNALWCWVI